MSTATKNESEHGAYYHTERQVFFPVSKCFHEFVHRNCVLCHVNINDILHDRANIKNESSEGTAYSFVSLLVLLSVDNVYRRFYR